MRALNRTATEQDRAAIVLLWRQVFRDDPAFIEKTLDGFVGPGNLYVAEIEGRIAAILSSVPCGMAGRQGVYLYALATLPEYRGKGLMSGLMRTAETAAAETGAAFAALMPANGPLYTWYRKRGYTVTARLRTVEREIPPDLLATAEFDTVTARQLVELRQRYIEQPWLAFDGPRTGEVLADLYASGASTAMTNSGYAVYAVPNGMLEVAELFAVSDAEAMRLLQAIREREGSARARITLPAAGAVMAGEGSIQPAGLLKKLDPAFVADDIYIRFALDDIWTARED